MKNDDPAKALISIWFVFFVTLALFFVVVTFIRSEVGNLQDQINSLRIELLTNTSGG